MILISSGKYEELKDKAYESGKISSSSYDNLVDILSDYV